MAAVAAQQPVSAQVVGNAFVQQYYHILHHSPRLVHRFYQDISQLGRPEEDGSMSITTTMDAIEKKIVSLNYEDFRAEIKSVDAHESFNGGVQVLVTGYLTGKDNTIRNFVQAFFLAPQDRGYFVLNDMFRYVDHVAPNPALVSDTVIPIASAEPGKFSKTSKSHCSTETGDLQSGLPQAVLESFLSMPTSKTAENESKSMSWRNVVKKLMSLKPVDSEQAQLVNAEGDEYQALRETATQHWDSMKSYYHKAAAAFAKGEKDYASYLSEQGRLQSKMALEADEKASRDIFSARNKSIENVITIDLHGQHIKPAMKLLKLHLLFGAYLRSVRSLRVITGYGNHGVGKSKLKHSPNYLASMVVQLMENSTECVVTSEPPIHLMVITLLQKEGISWSEENRGTLLIELDGQTDFSFLDSGSDGD